MKTEEFAWLSKVRDYEVDCQGIVNNATYVNYLEQCRNDYVRTLGIDYHQYAKQGFNLVVAKMEVKYLFPLMMQDEFFVTAEMTGYDERRIYFKQVIQRKSDDALVVVATVSAACVDQKTGKACMPDILKAKLDSAHL